MASADHVLAEIVRRSLAFGVRVIVDPAQSVDNDGTPCGGYFCGDTRTLAVATGRQASSWLGVMLHEYCHLTQWAESIPAWRAYDDGMWHWLAGKTIANPRAAMRSVQAVEEDCERRTLRLIRELDAPVDVSVYTRAANAYIHFHNVVLAKRKWLRKGVVLQETPEVLRLANPTLDTDFRTTPKALRLELEKLV